METTKRISGEGALKILIVGNNPLELSRMLSTIQKIDGKRVVTEIAFDMLSILDRLSKFQPKFILIDDNIGKAEMLIMVKSLLKERKTKNIPITVLKNSNYREAIGSGVMNYMLKDNLTGESVYKELLNSLRLQKTQLYLYRAYKRRKGQLMRFFKSEPAFQI